MSGKTRIVLIGAAAVACIGMVSGVVWRLSDSYQIRQASRHLEYEDFRRRQRAMWWLGSIGGPRAAQIACDVVQTDPHPHVREAAAYSLRKMRAAHYFEQVRDAVVKEKPSEDQAKMAFYVARLGGRRAKPWLRKVSRASRSWLGLGAALGRLELGDLTANEIVFGYLENPNKVMRAFAAVRLARWIEIISEATGLASTIPSDPQDGVTAQQADQMIRCWRDHATTKLVRDNILWNRGRNPKWRRLVRLMGARTKAIRFLEID